MVWCGAVWCGVVWCGVVWCGVVWCGVWCVVWCGVKWCGVVFRVVFALGLVFVANRSFVPFTGGLIPHLVFFLMFDGFTVLHPVRRFVSLDIGLRLRIHRLRRHRVFPTRGDADDGKLPEQFGKLIFAVSCCLPLQLVRHLAGAVTVTP